MKDVAEPFRHMASGICLARRVLATAQLKLQVSQ